MPQTESAAFTAQFSADALLGGDLQTNARPLRRAEAAGTLARAHRWKRAAAPLCCLPLFGFNGGCVPARWDVYQRVSTETLHLFSCHLQP